MHQVVIGRGAGQCKNGIGNGAGADYLVQGDSWDDLSSASNLLVKGVSLWRFLGGWNPLLRFSILLWTQFTLMEPSELQFTRTYLKIN